MAKKIALKHDKSTASVSAFLKTLDTAACQEAQALITLFKQATNATPRLWGTTMIGFGEYDYERSNGDYGSYFATGFALRKSGPTIYIMPGYKDYSALLEKLGPHKLGKSCLYLKSLDDIDHAVLSKLIKVGLRDLKKSYTVRMN